MFLFLYAPIVVLIVFSFNDNRNVGVLTRPSFRWYEATLQDDNVLRSLRNSLVVALISTIVSTILGTAAGLALERYRFRGQRAGRRGPALRLPIIIPDVTMAVMLLLFFTQAFAIVNGSLGTRLNLGLTSISLAHIAFNISFVAAGGPCPARPDGRPPRGGRLRPVRLPLGGLPSGHAPADHAWG